MIRWTSAGAATNRTISACNTVVRVNGVWAMLCMASPPACSPPNNSPASTIPRGLDRPSRATVIASKPIDPTMPADSGTGTPDAVGPSAACTPASPARAPASTMVITVVRCDAHPRGRGGVRVGPHRLDGEPGGRPVQQPPDGHGGHQRHHEAEVQLAALQPREGGVPVDDRGDRVGPARPLERRRGEEVGQQPGGDVVHHDRHDHLVRAGPGLQPADDAAPDPAADHARPASRPGGGSPAAGPR